MRRTILLVASMILTLLVASGVALVAGIGSVAAQSSVVGPGESIQKAINAAHPGDTIVVRGVHREDVVIRKNGIKLRGDDAVIEAPTRAKADSPCQALDRGYLRPRRRERQNRQAHRAARERCERFWLHVPGLQGEKGGRVHDRHFGRSQRYRCGKPYHRQCR